MSLDLYIYYRVEERHAELLRSRVLAMQAELAAATGIAGALKRRPDMKDGRQTWMEIYPATPEGFESRLESAVAAAGLAALIDGMRHTEHFMDFISCA